MLLTNETLNLGRLKHTTKDDCENCREAKLQLRVRTTADGKDLEYLYCPKCEFEKKPRKSKADGIWKKQIQEVEYVETFIQSRGNSKRDGKNSNSGNRGGYKRSS